MSPSADADPGPGSVPDASASSDDPLGRRSSGTTASGRVTLHLDTPDTEPPAAGWLEPRLDHAMALAGVDAPDASLALLIVHDARMAQLHEQFSGVPGTTDVLTFDNREDPADPAEPLGGDLVLCADQARRQADAHGHDARTELLLYAVHGLLHLLGENDHDPAGYRRMHAREDALLTQLGVGPVFSRSAGGDPTSALPSEARS